MANSKMRNQEYDGERNFEMIVDTHSCHLLRQEDDHLLLMLINDFC